MFEQDGRYRWRFDIPPELRSSFSGKRTIAGTLTTRPDDLTAAMAELKPIVSAHKARIKRLRALPADYRLREAMAATTDHDEALTLLQQHLTVQPPDVQRVVKEQGGPEGMLWKLYTHAIADAAASQPMPAVDPYDELLPWRRRVHAARRIIETTRSRSGATRAKATLAPLVPTFEALGLIERPDTLENVANDWINSKPKGGSVRQPSTVRRLRGAVRRMVEFFGPVPMEAITSRQISAYIEAVEQLPAPRGLPGAIKGATLSELVAWADDHPDHPRLEATTRNLYVATVKAFFAWAWRTDRIPVDPSSKLERHKDERPRSQRRRGFTREELRRIVDVSKRQWGEDSERHLLLMLTVYTGLRLKEPCGLLRADLAKHGDAWGLRIQNNAHRRLKTAETERVIPLHPDLQAALLEQNARAAKVGGELLFPSMGGVRRRADRLSGQFTALICNHAHVEQTGKTSWHSFRHAWERHLVEIEAPDRVRKALAGEKASGRQGIYDSAPVWEQLFRWTAKMDPLGLRELSASL